MLVTYAALAASTLLMAASPLWIRLSDVDPVASLWLRMVIAASVLAALSAVQQARGAVPALAWSLRRRLVLASAIFALDLACVHVAVDHTNIANVALLMNASPIFVAPLAFFLLGERQAPGQIAGLAAASAGVVVLFAGGLGEARLLGDGLALASALFFAVYVLVAKDVNARSTALQMMLWNAFVTIALVAPWVFLREAPLLPHSAMGWGMIAAMALGSQLIGHGLFLYALRGVSASFAAITLLAHPVLAAVLSWLVLAEVPARTDFIAGALVLTGLGTAFLAQDPALAGRLKRAVARVGGRWAAPR